MFEVIPTNKKIDINIPKAFIPEFNNILSDTQLRLAKQISNKYNLDYNDLVNNCIPTTPILNSSMINKQVNNNILITMDNIYETSDISQLNSLLVKDLKPILSKVNISGTGKKEILVSKLWNHICEYKQKNKLKYETIPIFFDTNLNITDVSSNTLSYFIIPEKKWVFKNENSSLSNVDNKMLKYIGNLVNNKLIECSGNEPEELKEYISNL